MPHLIEDVAEGVWKTPLLSRVIGMSNVIRHETGEDRRVFEEFERIL
jgi:hypothetical protein